MQRTSSQYLSRSPPLFSLRGGIRGTQRRRVGGREASEAEGCTPHPIANWNFKISALVLNECRHSSFSFLVIAFQYATQLADECGAAERAKREEKLESWTASFARGHAGSAARAPPRCIPTLDQSAAMTRALVALVALGLAALALASPPGPEPSESGYYKLAGAIPLIARDRSDAIIHRCWSCLSFRFARESSLWQSASSRFHIRFAHIIRSTSALLTLLVMWLSSVQERRTRTCFSGTSSLEGTPPTTPSSCGSPGGLAALLSSRSSSR